MLKIAPFKCDRQLLPLVKQIVSKKGNIYVAAYNLVAKYIVEGIFTISFYW